MSADHVHSLGRYCEAVERPIVMSEPSPSCACIESGSNSVPSGIKTHLRRRSATRRSHFIFMKISNHFFIFWIVSSRSSGGRYSLNSSKNACTRSEAKRGISLSLKYSCQIRWVMEYLLRSRTCCGPPKYAIVLKIWSGFLGSKCRSGSLLGSTIPVH